MPKYKIWREESQNSVLSASISEASWDLDNRWIQIAEAEIGHVHFHLNTARKRVQGWILEHRAWQEYDICWNGEQGLDVMELVRNKFWSYRIANAQRMATRGSQV